MGLVLLAGVTACSSEPDAEPSAQALAEALASGEFDAVPLAELTGAEVEADVTEIVAGLGELRPDVELAEVAAIDGQDLVRAAALDVSWDLGDGAEWTYQTHARLRLVEDRWQVEWSPAVVHPELDAGDRLDLHREPAPRADVLGRNGPLVTARPVYRIGIDKVRAAGESVASAARELAALVDVDAARFVDRVTAAGPRAFVPAITLRKSDAEPLLAGIAEIGGARAISGSLPLAPTREFARPILGTVGKATAEIVEESGGAVRPGDLTGLSGLQRAYDEVLRGSAGYTVDKVPAEGDSTPLYEQEPVPAEPLRLTLDAAMQHRAEELLSGFEPPSALVAIQPSTGDVLAAASGPGGQGYSTATLGQYAPGSTFKVVTSLALLRAGLSASSVVSCPASTTVDGKEFGNYDDYPSSAIGEIALNTAVAESCNTAFIGLRDDVSQADLATAAAGLGLGAEPDLGFPAFMGSVPAEPESATEHAASLIGQGRALASPLAMATVTASVVAGHTVTPRLIAEAPPSAGDATPDGGGSTPSEPSRAATAGAGPGAGGGIATDEAQVLRELMRSVVEEGSAAFLSDVPGEPVGAKTGTAEYGSDVPPSTHGWLIGFQGDLAVAVFVEDAESGSQTAGPVLEDFLTSVAQR